MPYLSFLLGLMKLYLLHTADYLDKIFFECYEWLCELSFLFELCDHLLWIEIGFFFMLNQNPICISVFSFDQIFVYYLSGCII